MLQDFDRPIHVLLLEDTESDAILLRSGLEEPRALSFVLTHVERLSEALERLRKEPFDVILSDLQVPDSRGLDTFLSLHQHSPEVPIVVLTSNSDERMGLKAVQEGAQDYLVKGRVDGNATARSIRYAIERHRTRSALRASEVRYRSLFENAPVGLLEGDFSGIRDWLEVRSAGADLPEWFRSHPEALRECASRVRILDANQTALQWFRTRAKDDLLADGFPAPFGDMAVFEAALLDLLEGRMTFEAETTLNVRGGPERYVTLRLAVAPECARNWSRVLVSLSDITQRRWAEEQIRNALMTKDMLLHEIHHRVKNNLQIVSSLLSLQAGTVANKSVLEALQQSQDRIRAIALTHDRLHQSKDLASVDMAQYMRDLVPPLLHSFGLGSTRVLVDIRSDDTPIGIDSAVICGLIANELISNCIKHAFPNGRTGRIKLTLTRRPDKSWVMIVEDDGVGFPSDVDSRATSSLGMRIVVILARQLSGKVELEASQGTRFTVTFQDADHVPA